MIADAKLTGSVAKGISVAHYMLNPDAKINDEDVKKMQSSGGHERILHIETDHALPVLISASPKTAAQSFIHEVTDWNTRNRPGKKAPKSHWEHRVVSFHPSDSKKLDARTACKIVKESLGIVAPGQRPTLFVMHGDTEHLHVHMLYATVDETGKIHNPHQDFRLWEQAMESLEIKYDLYRVDKRMACAERDSKRMPDGTNPGKAEFRMTQRTGEPSCKQRLRELIDESVTESMQASPTKQFSQFLRSLRSKKIGVSANIQSTNTVAGIRFHYGIFSNGGIKASALGKAYSWNQLASTVGFNQSAQFNTQLLKLSDQRVTGWINHESGGKKYATQLTQNINNISVKTPAKSGKISRASNSSSAATISPEFPVEYPEWLKAYIRALVRAANAALARQHQHNSQLCQSIEMILKLLESFQKRAIENHLTRNTRRTASALVRDTSRHADYKSLPSK